MLKLLALRFHPATLHAAIHLCPSREIPLDRDERSSRLPNTTRDRLAVCRTGSAMPTRTGLVASPATIGWELFRTESVHNSRRDGRKAGFPRKSEKMRTGREFPLHTPMGGSC